MSKSKIDRKKLKPATRLASAAREFAEHGMVNPAVYRASTITFPTVEAMKHPGHGYTYARRGTPTSRAIETAIAELEGGYACKVAPSGVAAITATMLAFLKAGDHVLVTDAVYGNTRDLCGNLLAGLGVGTTYYDPLIGEKLRTLIKPNTRMVYLECPGSQTMEMQDVPLLARIAHEAGAIAVLDNTWSGGYYFNAFEHGCDVSVQAATKYITGHSDCMFGSVVCNEATWQRFKSIYETMGLFAGPDDMYLALRGLRTLDVRLERHMKSAIQVAEWLRARPEVETVLHPALSNAPGHAIWKRDFTGASGLFSIILKPTPDKAVAAMLDAMDIFSMGYSWGGFESLILPYKPQRSATKWQANGPALRLHIGLEHPDDLITDLERGIARLNAAT
jgi:cystathionine beta-lyase